MTILHTVKQANTGKSDREVNPIKILSLESIVQSPKTKSKRRKYFFFILKRLYSIPLLFIRSKMAGKVS